MMAGHMVIEAVFGVYLMGYSIGLANTFKRATSKLWQRVAVPLVASGSVWMVCNVAMATLPVLRSQEATVELREPGAVVLSVYADKARACRWLSTDAYVIDANGRKREAGLIFERDRLIDGHSRPLGWQWYGLWRLHFDRTLAPPVAAELHTWHSCGWMWQTTHTITGPIDLRR